MLYLPQYSMPQPGPSKAVPGGARDTSELRTEHLHRDGHAGDSRSYGRESPAHEVSRQPGVGSQLPASPSLEWFLGMSC